MSRTTEVERWRATVDDLGGQLAKAETAVADLSARRRAILLPAKTGDVEAAAELGRQDADLARLQREVRDLGQALEDAKVELIDAEEREAEVERRKALARAADLDREAAGLAGKVDEALAGIKGTIDRVLELVREADGLRGEERRRSVPTPGGLVHSSMWNGALSFHQLAGAHHVHSALRRSFADSIRGLRSSDAVAGDDPGAGEQEAA